MTKVKFDQLDVPALGFVVLGTGQAPFPPVMGWERTLPMDLRSTEPLVTAVAGCLFEVSLPEAEGASWWLAEPGAEVTLVSESVRGPRRHFRFRAEAGAAVAGAVALRFRSQTPQRGMCLRIVEVPVAPEHEPEG